MKSPSGVSNYWPSHFCGHLIGGLIHGQRNGHKGTGADLGGRGGAREWIATTIRELVHTRTGGSSARLILELTLPKFGKTHSH
jgi:hypothetical protein